MSDKIDTRISPQLDPQLYVEMDGYHEHANFVGMVVNAVSFAHQTLQQVHTARGLVAGNGAWNEDQKSLEVGKMATARNASVRKKLELARRDLEANITHAEKQLLEPLVERANLGNLNAEVRAHVKALKTSGEREKFMREALQNDDDATLEAILGAQHFLSGMTALDRDHYLREYHTRKRPDLVRRLDVMHRFREQLDRIERVIPKEFEKAVGATFAKVAMLDRADELARAALAAEPTV